MRFNLRLLGRTSDGKKCQADVAVYANSQPRMQKEAKEAAKTAPWYFVGGGDKQVPEGSQIIVDHVVVLGTGSQTGNFEEVKRLIRARLLNTEFTGNFEEVKRLIRARLDIPDLSQVSDLSRDTFRRELRLVVEGLCDTENPLLNRMERERLIEEVLEELLGHGPPEG